MNVLIVSNCVTAGYYRTVTALFPHWNVKAAGIHESERWVLSGEKPEFTAYLRTCELYIGWNLDGHVIEAELNPKAERVIVPELYFRGLHPDVARLNGFWGPFSTDSPHTQSSIIMFGAKALGMTREETKALFCGEIYDKLGFFDLYKSEKTRVVEEFARRDIQLGDVFDYWEAQGDFFYICHHPKAFVLVDIIRCALKGRFLSYEAFANSEGLRRSAPDTLDWTEVWPVYPEIARARGFTGGLTWLRNKSHLPREMQLSDVIDRTFTNLEKMDNAWTTVPFIAECAKLLAASGDEQIHRSNLATLSG